VYYDRPGLGTGLGLGNEGFGKDVRWGFGAHCTAGLAWSWRHASA